MTKLVRASFVTAVIVVSMTGGARVASANLSPVTSMDCDYYVSTSGSDANSGTDTDPWRHVGYAVNAKALELGGVVCVREGTYHENVVFNQSGPSSAARIVVAADPDAEDPVIIDGTIAEVIGASTVDYIDNPCECAPAFSIQDDDHLRITGLVIKNRGNARYTEPGDVGHGGWPAYNPNHCPAGVAAQCAAQGVRIIADANVSVTDIIVDHCVIEAIFPAYEEAIGTPIAVAAMAVNAEVSQLQITDNTMGNSDTTTSAGITDGVIAFAGSVEDFLIDGNQIALDNQVDDVDGVGVSLGGNQGETSNHPEGGVISANHIYGGSTTRETYAIYVQAGQQILIERNFLQGVGRGVGVLTEPPCGIVGAVNSEDVWIRNNLFVGVYNNDLVTGAFGGSTKCGSPVAYEPVSDVYFTNNTIYHFNKPPYAAIYVPKAGSNGLTGTSKFENNLVFTPGWIANVTLPSGSTLTMDYNFLDSTDDDPYVWNDTGTADEDEDLSFADWRTASGQDAHSTAAGAPFVTSVFASPGSLPAESAFHLASSSAAISGGVSVSGTFSFGSFAPASELDYYGGARTSGTRDIGADEY